MNTPWLCPRCQKVNAPHVDQCARVPEAREVQQDGDEITRKLEEVYGGCSKRRRDDSQLRKYERMVGKAFNRIDQLERAMKQGGVVHANLLTLVNRQGNAILELLERMRSIDGRMR